MVAFSANPWVGYVLPDRAPSAGAGHRTKALHPDKLAYFRTSVQTAVVSASLGGFFKVLEIELLRAHADAIACQTDKAVIKNDGAIATLTAILTRDDSRGSVSDGTKVLFKATQQGDTSKGVGFLSSESATTTDGSASVMFAANTGDVILDQPVTLTMSTKKDAAGEIETCTLPLHVEE